MNSDQTSNVRRRSYRYRDDYKPQLFRILKREIFGDSDLDEDQIGTLVDLTQGVRMHAITLGVDFGQVKLSSSRYRWGSCTPMNNIIWNWRLIKAPMPVIDYLSVYELAHL